LNACGTNGAAGEVSAHLRKNGFDVVDIGNNDEWYYDHTIIASRKKNMTVAKQVASVLGTERFFFLRHKSTLLDVTVFVGKDYERLIKDL